MKKGFRRMTALLAAASLALSMPAVSRAAEPETLDTAGVNHWEDWPDKGPRSQDYPAGADGSLVLYVEGTTGVDDIIMEITDGTNFITANTQPDAGKNLGVWSTDTNVACKVENADSKSLNNGTSKTKNVVKITIKSQKSGSTKSFTMDLYDTVTKKTLMAFSAVGSSMADTWTFHIVSVYGGVKIYSEAPDGVDTTGGGNVSITAKPDNTTTGSTSTGTTQTAKKKMKLSGVKVKKGAKKITGKVSVKKATVKIKVGSKKYKKAKVSGRSFTLKTAKLKKKTKVTVKVTKSGYKTLTKTYKVK